MLVTIKEVSGGGPIPLTLEFPYDVADALSFIATANPHVHEYILQKMGEAGFGDLQVRHRSALSVSFVGWEKPTNHERLCFDVYDEEHYDDLCFIFVRETYA